MPTYEYKCDGCGNEFEKFQSIMAAPIKKCPKCGKAKVRRLIGTGAGLIFKGSGFYITDYRDKSYTDKAKAETGAAGGEKSGDAKPETKGESKAETKSDAKAETKSEPKPAEGKPAQNKPAESKPQASKSAAKAASSPKPSKKK